MENYDTLQLSVEEGVGHLALNRPDEANAMNLPFWEECRRTFEWMDQAGEVRVAVLSGNGKHFSSGIDLDLMETFLVEGKNREPGRRAESLRRLILRLQEAFTAIERCRVPVIAAVQGACIGGGVDMISACDLRFCSANAFFVIKEVDIGITADVGTLQRLPRIIGDGIMRELAYTGRKVSGKEAREIGLVNRVFDDKEAMMAEVMKIARSIAEKSPLAIRGIKEMILYGRDHTVADGLNYVATWNAAMLSEAEVREALAAQTEKRRPAFED